jgi:chaperonin GroEL
MVEKKTQRVVFQPSTYEAMQDGINQMVNVIRPTLGPRPRIVAIDKVVGGKMPEMLDDGGTIARRIIQIPGRDADMGAMFLRQMVWRMHEKVGDGTATAAVILQSVYNQGLRYIAAGGNAMALRRALESTLPVLYDEFESHAIPVDGKVQLAQIAESICYDPPLSKMLGEIFDIIGEHGQLDVRSGRSREIEREYVEGMYWKGSPFSRQMITDKSELRTKMDNAAILISDLMFEDPQQLVPLVRMAMQSGIESVMILARKVSDAAIGFLMANSRSDKFQSVAVKTPGMTTTDIAATLQDMAVLTGGRAFVTAAGDTLAGIRPEDLGRARRAWVDRYNFGIVGGRGDPRAVRQHIADLRQAFSRAKDADSRKSIQQRIGKLMGGSATLWVGGATKLQIDARKELAERTAGALRGVVSEGVVPGGGVTLLACREPIRQMLEATSDTDEQAAYRIVIRALEEPIRAIVENAGYDASDIMADIRLTGPGHGFDVTSERVVDVAEAGIFDSVAVQREAVRAGIESAALALTIDVLVHRKKPLESVNP